MNNICGWVDDGARYVMVSGRTYKHGVMGNSGQTWRKNGTWEKDWAELVLVKILPKSMLCTFLLGKGQVTQLWACQQPDVVNGEVVAGHSLTQSLWDPRNKNRHKKKRRTLLTPIPLLPWQDREILVHYFLLSFSCWIPRLINICLESIAKGFTDLFPIFVLKKKSFTV